MIKFNFPSSFKNSIAKSCHFQKVFENVDEGDLYDRVTLVCISWKQNVEKQRKLLMYSGILFYCLFVVFF